MQTKNLLKIDANKQVKLSNIAALILNYDLAGKSVEKVNSNYKYIYKIFAKLGLCDVKKNINGDIKIPLHFVKKLLKELQKDPDKFIEKYVEVKQENGSKKPKYYSANYCYKLLEEINNYEQQTAEVTATKNDINKFSKFSKFSKFINFIKNPQLSNFPKDIKADNDFVEVIRNLSPKNHIIFKFLFPDWFHIFYIYLSNIFYENAENTMILEFDKIYYQFENINDLKEEELDITKLINIANNKLKFYGWNNTKIRFSNNSNNENKKHIKIIFTNQQQQNNNLNFGDVISLNLKNKAINICDENTLCLVKKSLQDIQKNIFCDDFAEVIINNICNQIYFNNKVIEFLKNNDLFNKFFNTENEETYKEVITNLYNLQIMYNHLKEVHNNGFLIDKIF